MGEKMKKFIKYLCLVIFILNIIVILAESLVPGKASASQSDAVADKVVDIIDTFTPPKEEEIIYPTSIEIKSDNQIYIGESKKITVEASPKDANYVNIEWVSQNSEIATVNANGVVIGRGIGTTTITGRLKDNQEVFDTVTIEVVKKPFVQLTDFKITGSLEVYLWESRSTTSKLMIDTTPSNATIDSISWTSLNNEIIKVSQTGVVSANQLGSAEIEVAIVSGAETIKKIISVSSSEFRIIGIQSVNISSDSICYIGRTLQLNSNVIPLEELGEGKYLDKTVNWQVDDEKIATIDANGNLTGHSAGTVKVTIISEYDETKTASVDIEIKPVPIESVQTNIDNNKLIAGEDFQIEYEIFPADATEKTLYFKSNSKCLVVNNDGHIFATKAGKAVIEITDEEGNVYEKFTIEVTRKPLFTAETIQNLRYTIRKSIGHFGAFFTLGIFGFLSFFFFIKKKWLRMLLTLTVGIVIGVVSELFQKITVGRYCTVNDMIIDSAGYLSSVILLLIISLIIYFFKKSKNKKRLKNI